ncbi:MAG: hypothetical protein AAB478_00950 [Patescibacteria group bacterium]
MNVRRILAGAVASAVMFSAMAVPAFGANPGYGEQPGYAKASACGQVHGSFSYFDGDTNLGVKSLGPGTPVYHGGAVGQEPGATGYNNSNTDCQE